MAKEKEKDPKPPKEKPAKKQPAKKGGLNDQPSLPLYAEVFYSFSTVLLLLVTLMIAVVSFMSGASLMEVFLRAVVGVVALGSILWFLTYQVSSGLLNARTAEQPAKNEAVVKAEQSRSRAGGDMPTPSSGGEVKE